MGIRQRGIAAVTALLVVTIATIAAAELIWELNLNVRRAEGLLLREQAIQISIGAEIWAKDILYEDLQEGGANSSDNREENWAQNIPAIPIEGGTVDGFIEDLQGRFNLNNLVNPRGEVDAVAVEHFRRLLVLLELSPDLADAVVDWIDPDQFPETYGAEDDFYTSQTPPYLAANFWFTTPTELLAVRGFDREAYQIIEPYVAALPVGGAPTRININTAAPILLASVWPDVDPVQAEGWQETIYEDLEEFADIVTADLDQESDPDYAAMQVYLDTGSSFFEVNVSASIGTTRLSMYSLLERTTEGAVTTRLRSFDTH